MELVAGDSDNANVVGGGSVHLGKKKLLVTDKILSKIQFTRTNNKASDKHPDKNGGSKNNNLSRTATVSFSAEDKSADNNMGLDMPATANGQAGTKLDKLNPDKVLLIGRQTTNMHADR